MTLIIFTVCLCQLIHQLTSKDKDSNLLLKVKIYQQQFPNLNSLIIFP
jgi:hypothetical protein